MNRRSFLSTILAASTAPSFVRFGSLMRPRVLAPAPSLRLACSISYISELFETVRVRDTGLVHTYVYSADVGLIVPKAIGVVSRVWADGRSLNAEVQVNEDGLAILRNFDLTEYGNRIPSFEIES